MDLLQELGRETRLPRPDELAPARSRLVGAIRTERGAVAQPQRPVRRARRLVLAGSATAAVAAALAVVLVVVPDKVGGEVPAANADAAQVLHKAAAAALTVPDVEPRADQFVYVRSRQGDGSIREVWWSVDGTRDGLLQVKPSKDLANVPLPGCRNGRAAVVKGNTTLGGRTEACTPRPAYPSDLPTDADAMLAYLNANGTKQPGKDVLGLIAESYLRPAQRAALFEAAARIPGLTAVGDVKDGAGRPGIGISWSRDGKSNVLVFDAQTYAFLGMARYLAVLEVALVDEVGQRP